MPYRTVDNRIDGVVITFADITGAKALEAELRKRQNLLESRIKKHVETIRKAEPKHSA